MVYEYVLFLHMHIKSTIRNAAGKLLLWLTMLNKSAMMGVQWNRLVYLFIQLNFCISYDFIIPRCIFCWKKKVHPIPRRLVSVSVQLKASLVSNVRHTSG